MKICVAQIKPTKGNIQQNLDLHIKFIQHAIEAGADCLFFSELSLTGYEPELAENLTQDPKDDSFDQIQLLSNANDISIGMGLPTKSETGICISMVVFQPNQERLTYSKQHLHDDEKPFFVPGDQSLIFSMKDMRVVPAICYESLLPAHAEQASELGADIYLASVAKAKSGVHKALNHFPKIAQKHSMIVAMVNCIGPCGNFVGNGTSSFWDNKGNLIGQLGGNAAGILILDTEKLAVFKQEF